MVKKIIRFGLKFGSVYLAFNSVRYVKRLEFVSSKQTLSKQAKIQNKQMHSQLLPKIATRGQSCHPVKKLYFIHLLIYISVECFDSKPK